MDCHEQFSVDPEISILQLNCWLWMLKIRQCLILFDKTIGLIKETKMLSYPVEQSFRSDLRDLSTSLYVTFCSLKLSWLLVSQSMWDNITSSVVAFCPTSLSAVLLKYSFSADGSACSVLRFWLRIRWITSQISLLFFENKTFLWNCVFLSLIAFWILFLDSL